MMVRAPSRLARLTAFALSLSVALTGCGNPRSGALLNPQALVQPAGTVAPTGTVLPVGPSTPGKPTPTLTTVPELTPTATVVPSATPGEPRSVSVPILLYHHIRDASRPVRYSVGVERFEGQLDDLVAAGYHTVTVEDVVNAIRQGTPLPPRPVVLTFDDGNRDILDNAFPLMQARGMVGVVYVIAGRLACDVCLRAEDLRSLRSEGWEIGSHGLTHQSLVDLPAGDQAAEILGSKEKLEAALGEAIDSFAFPFGLVSNESLSLVIQAGYTAGVGLGISNSHDVNDLYYLSRREVRGTYDLQAFRALLAAP